MSPLGLVRRTVSRALTGRRAAVALATVGVVLVAVAVVVTFTDPPDRVLAAEVDGRTWLTVPRSDGDALVLANGVSGLVEAEAEVEGGVPAGLRFAGSDGRHTVLSTGSAAVLLFDGSQAGRALDVGGPSVLGGGGVLSAASDVTIRPVHADGSVGDPVTVADTGAPLSGAAPVVDGSGGTWILTTTSERDARAVRVSPAGRVSARADVDRETSGLIVVDGRPFAVGPDVLDEVDGGDTLPAAGANGIVPAVARETGGHWAVASGRRITVDDGTVTMTAPADVDALAVWYGTVWVATAEGAYRSARDGTLERIDGVDGPFEVFADGGRLWFVGAGGAIAVDRGQQPTVFRLAGVELSLCAGDCSPDAAVDYLDDLDDITPTTPPPDAGSPAPTTAPAPGITLPPVLPTTSTTTTTTSPPRPAVVVPSTTVPAGTTTTSAATVPVPATAPVTSGPVLAPPATPPATTPATGPPVTFDPAAPQLPPPPAPEPDPTPPRPRPTIAPNDPTAPPTTPAPPPTPPATPPSTTEPPAAAGNVILGFSSATSVVAGFDGDERSCRATGGSASGGSTTGVVTWAGGRRDVSVRVPGSGSVSIDATATEVSFSICGLSASISRTVVGPPPTVGGIDVSGSRSPGATVTASVGVGSSPGWVAAYRWTASNCALGSNGSSSVPVTLPASGRCTVSVIVSLVASGSQRDENRSTSIDVVAPTTTTAPATTTTQPPPPTTTLPPPPTTTLPPPPTTTLPPPPTTTLPPPPTTTLPPPPTTTLPPPPPTTTTTLPAGG